MAMGLAAYTLIQAATFSAARHAQPGAPSTAARMLVPSDPATTTLAVTPVEAERSKLSADDSGSERGVSAAPALPAALGSKTRASSPLYDLAAARYGLNPKVLRALHEVESAASPSGCIVNRQGSGAVGPFQFKPVTFRQYAVDADGDGQTEICEFADSLFAAARYLKALGADASIGSSNTHRALIRYGTPANRVVALAAGAQR